MCDLLCPGGVLWGSVPWEHTSVFDFPVNTVKVFELQWWPPYRPPGSKEGHSALLSTILQQAQAGW